MRVTEVTNDDGRMCAQLLNLIKSGRWDLSGSEAEALVATKRWLQQLAGLMAEQLKPSAKPIAAPAAEAPMRIKSMGQTASVSSPRTNMTPKKKKR